MLLLTPQYQILCVNLELLNLLNHFLENYIAARSAAIGFSPPLFRGV